MRVGLIGCGTVALGGHLPALHSHPDIDLVALADVRPDHLQEVGRRYGVQRCYTNYRDLLADPDVEAVTIATPVGSHYAIARAALEAGKHVFCEKPLTDTVNQGWELVAMARQAGRLLAVNFEMRATEPYDKIKELVDQGVVGRLYFLRLIYNWAGGRWAGMARHRMLMTEGKGPIFDCGVHFFDLARWYSGSEIVTVDAAGLYMENYPYPDHVVATCQLASGALAVVDESWVFGHTCTGSRYELHRIDLEGDQGTLTAEHHQGAVALRVQSASGSWSETYRYGKAFATMYTRWVASVRSGQLCGLASGEDGVRAVEAAEAALQRVAARRGNRGSA